MRTKHLSAIFLTVAVALFAITGTLALLNGQSANASPGVRYVAPGGDCGGVSPCYEVIQDAVDAADQDDILQ